MSLFRVREWWASSVGRQGEGEEEKFAHGCCTTGKLMPPDKHQREQVIVGSHTGELLIFDPGASIVQTEERNLAQADGNFRPEHVLVELQMSSPIVQVLTGRLVANADRDQLAVLHPRKLAIYGLNAMESNMTVTGNTYTLTPAYEHSLPRTAFNMVAGAFGGSTNRHFLCVQSLDGTLSFFEQESFTFARFLPLALLPGPLTYVPMADCFVTVASSYQLESYKYQTLAVAIDAKSKSEAQTMTVGKKVAPDWTFELGESAVDLAVVEMSPSQPSILVLGERNIVCLTEGGTLRFIHKLDYHPVALHAYSSTSEGFIQFMVASDTATVMVYADTQLRWTAKLILPPVQILRVTLSLAYRGFLLALSSGGQLTVGYLGTDPAFYGLPQTDTRHIDYRQRQQELQSLNAAIRASTSSTAHEIKGASAGNELTLTAGVSPSFDTPTLAYNTVHGDDSVPSITVTLNIRPVGRVDDVIIFVTPHHPIDAHQTSFHFSSLSAPQDIPVTLFVRHSFVTASLSLPCSVVYTSATGARRTVSCEVSLPLALVARPCHAVKNAVHKITIDSNSSTVPLTTLFPEFATDVSDDGTIMGFEHLGVENHVVSVLASKNNNKYRVQSDIFESLWLLVGELVRRLRQHSPSVQLSYSQTPPLIEYFALLDHHFELHKRVLKLNALLSGRCQQLRAVQRRLLTKFKETSTSPLAHLDGLMEMTHRQVLNMASAIQDLQLHLKSRSVALSAATRLVLCLLRLHVGLSSEDYHRVSEALSPFVDTFHEQTWQQRVDTSVAYVLHTVNKGHTSVSPANSQMPPMSDSERLKKHVQLLCEKLSSGSHLPTPTVSIDEKQSKPSNKKKAAPVRMSSNAQTTTTTMISKPSSVGKQLETIVEDTTVADANDGSLGDAAMPIGSTFGAVVALTSTSTAAVHGYGGETAQLGARSDSLDGLNHGTEMVRKTSNESVESAPSSRREEATEVDIESEPPRSAESEQAEMKSILGSINGEEPVQNGQPVKVDIAADEAVIPADPEQPTEGEEEEEKTLSRPISAEDGETVEEVEKGDKVEDNDDGW